MKKKIAMTIVASVVMSLAGTAFAADIPNPLDLKFDGSVTVQYRNDGFKNVTDNGVPAADTSANGIKTTAILNIDKPITSNFDVYARATYQGYLNDGKNFSDVAAYAADSKYNGAIDAVGVTYKNAGTFYKIGSQAFTLGATGLVYDNTYLGKHALPYTALVAGKVGAFDYAALYGRTNYQDGVTNDKFYGTQFFTKLNPKTKVGGLWVHEKVDSIPGVPLSVNVYGANAAYQFNDKLSFVTEYIKANYDNDSFNHDNTGYVGSLTYTPNKVNSFGISVWRVGQNASAYDHNIGRLTTFWANAEGYSLSWNRQLGTGVTLNVADHIFSHIKDGAGYDNTADRNSFRAGVSFTF